MNRSEKYRQAIINKYGSWDNYLKERNRRAIEKHGSEEIVSEIRKAIASKGGKMSTSRPFRDIDGLAKQASDKAAGIRRK